METMIAKGNPMNNISKNNELQNTLQKGEIK